MHVAVTSFNIDGAYKYYYMLCVNVILLCVYPLVVIDEMIQ